MDRINLQWLAMQVAFAWLVIGAALLSGGFTAAGVLALLAGVWTWIGA